MVTRSLILALFASASAAVMLWGFAPPPPASAPAAPQAIDAEDGPPATAPDAEHHKE